MNVSSKNSGFALVTALGFLLVTVAIVGTVMILGVTNLRLANDTIRTTQAQYAAEAGAEQALLRIWNAPLAPYTNSNRTLGFYRTMLNPVISDGKKLTFSDKTADGNSYDVSVLRTDESQKTLLTITSRGKTVDGPDSRVLQQTLTIQTASFNGIDFALLSNNVNCTFCHTSIQTMQSAYGGNPDGQNRVKVATLNSLELRVATAPNQYDAVDTLINGTLYSRGSVVNQSRQAFNMSDTDDVRFTKLDNVSGKVNYDSSKSLANNAVRANVQDCSYSNQCKSSNNNFYQNYPQSNGIDGNLPDDFPLPVPDLNGDRYISNDEWTANLKNIYQQDGGKNGSIGFQNQTYNTYPYANVIVQQTTITETETNKMNKKITNGSLQIPPTQVSSGDDQNRGVAGNLYLSGTVKIDGTVFVDGDVVIGKNFKVSGSGKIVARGNVYVTSDIEYDCSTPDKPNQACNYADPASLPQLAVVAGGNILAGDYLSPNNASVKNLNDSKVTEPGWPDNFNKNAALSFVAAEIANFNKLEYEKALANNNYIPRLYRMRPTDPIMRYTGSGENASNYNTGQIQLVGETISTENNSFSKSPTKNSNEQNILDRAQVLDLSPTEDWISEATVKQAWIDNVETPVRPMVKSLTPNQPSIRKPLQIDASLYSSNATFALARGCSNVGPCPRSNVDGRMTVNGSIISADMGLLAPGSGGKKSKFVDGQRDVGLRVNYDARIPNLLRLDYGDVVTLARSDYQLVKAAP